MQEIIQVAGVIDFEEAELLINSGVNYIGFPLRLPVNKEDLSEEEAASIIKKIPLSIKSVLITYLDNAKDIVEFVDKLGVNVIQLHGKISKEELRKTKELKPNLEIIKSLVIGEYNQDELYSIVNEQSDWIDAFITDTYDPSTGASGATGKTHDWNISKKIVNMSSKPVILAGGLNANNVKEAILTVRPAGVDVHTGIENNSGRKDPELLKRFVFNAKQAFNEIKGF